MMNKVIFACTANMYRSRLAELLFNAYAAEDHIKWVAESRALSAVSGLSGMSSLVTDYLEQKGKAELATDARDPLPLKVEEFEQADMVVAMCRSEHESLILSKFTSLARKRMDEGTLVFWNVFDTESRLPWHMRILARLGGFQTQHPVSGMEHIDFAVQALVRKLAW